MHTARLLCFVTAVSLLLSSCINIDKAEKKIDKRSESYYKKQHRSEMRAYARDDRYDDWVDRMLD